MTISADAGDAFRFDEVAFRVWFWALVHRKTRSVLCASRHVFDDKAGAAVTFGLEATRDS